MTWSAIPRPADILLVEDSPTDALLVREALECSGVAASLQVVDDGEKALAYLRHHAPTPTLILLDLNLPGKSGLQVLAEIKQDALLASIPIVIVTTSKADTDVARAYQLHANCLVNKPVEFHRFVEAIRLIHQFWFQVVTLPPTPKS